MPPVLRRVGAAIRGFFTLENAVQQLLTFAMVLAIPALLGWFFRLPLLVIIPLAISVLLFWVAYFLAFHERGKNWLKTIVSTRKGVASTATDAPVGDRFEAISYADGGSVVLVLRCVTSSNVRPGAWSCRVTDPAFPASWSARITPGVGLERQNESPDGEIHIRFPDDFVGVPQELPRNAWYLAEWVRPRFRPTGQMLEDEELPFAKTHFEMPPRERQVTEG